LVPLKIFIEVTSDPENKTGPVKSDPMLTHKWKMRQDGFEAHSSAHPWPSTIKGSGPVTGPEPFI